MTKKCEMKRSGSDMYSMRPITLSRIIEVCHLTLKYHALTENNLIEDLKVSKNRAREIGGELCKMNLLKKTANKKYSSNRNTNLLLRLFRTESWEKFSNYFYQNYKHYKMFIDLFEYFDKNENCGKSVDELLAKALKKGNFLNRTSLEVMTNWGERLGKIQRNLFNGTFYAVNKKSPSLKDFGTSLLECYSSLNIRRGLNLRLVYVEIPKLREVVCERLQIPCELFDTVLLRIYRRNLTRMEFSGAPITTVTKKSRYSIRTIGDNVISHNEGKANNHDSYDNSIKYRILSVKLNLEKERKGIKLYGKEYYYLAIRGKLQ